MTTRLKEILRFLVAGGSTTAFSYGIYLMLLFASVHYLTAYVVSFVAGVFWSYFVNSRFVFGRRLTVAGFLAFPLVYVVQLAAGAGAVHLAISIIGLPAWSGPLIAVVLTLPLTYASARWIIHRTSTPPSLAGVVAPGDMPDSTGGLANGALSAHTAQPTGEGEQHTGPL